MSRRETLSLAHTAKCKLRIAADQPDRNLRFLLGHALTLDSINMRLIQIEEDNRVVKKPSHSSSVKFKAAGNSVGRSPLSGRQKTPPPVNIDHGDVEDAEPSSESDHEELCLQRFPSAAAQPRRPSPEIPVDVHGEVSSSDDEELDSFLSMIETHLTHESLEKITKNETDQTLADLYHSIQKCPCHKSDAPDIKNFWEVPLDQGLGGMKGFDNIRLAIAEIAA